MRAEGVVQDVTTQDMEITAALREAVIRQLGRERFELWFGSQGRWILRDQQLVVEVATPIYQNWLRNNFRQPIEQCCRAVLGKDVAVDFQLKPQPAEGQPPAALPGGAGSPDRSETTNSAAGPSPPLDSPPPRLDSTMAPRDAPPAARAPARQRTFSDFDSFVVGHCNRVAHASALMVAERPGCVSPLFLYGGTGVGKTHLLECVWSQVLGSRPGCGALFMAAEQFTSLFLEALHHSGLPNFRRKYRNVELLVLDDVQFFTGKKATLCELLHTIDTLLRNERQVVLAADRPPADLGGLGPDLTSRLTGGMVCRMEPADRQTRGEIVRRYARRNEISLSDEVLEMVASRLSDNARELFGAVNRLHATSLATGSPLSLAAAEEALSDLVMHSSRVIKLDDIEKAVCEVFGLRPDSLRSQRKVRSVSHPRMLAMWLARKHTRSALSEIGDYFGRRSHTTVISAQKRINTWMSAGGHVGAAENQWHVEEAIRRVESRLRAG